MIRVSPRGRRHEDKSGDPLDGLVNMFDVGLVLAVAFLLAALASLDLSSTITRQGLTRPSSHEITVRPSDTVQTVPATVRRTVGTGSQVGTVYRLDDGRLIYVVPRSALPTTAPTTATPSPTPS